MRKITLFFTCIVLFTTLAHAQSDRFSVIQQRLSDLSQTSRGLGQKVDLSVSGVSIQEFLRGLAEANDLNINVDPHLDIRLYNSFKQETVANILLFLTREYDLDIRFVGSIMSFYRYIQPPVPVPVIASKEIGLKYNSYNDMLSMDLRDDTLSKVIRKLVQISKKNVVIAPGSTDKKVGIYIENLPFESALEKFAFSNRLTLSKTNDQVYIFGVLPDNEDPLHSMWTEYLSAPAAGKSSTVKSQRRKSRQTAVNGLSFDVNVDSMGKKMIDLDAMNVPVTDIIKAVANEMQVSYFLYTDLKGSATISISHVNFEQFLSYIFKNTDYTFKNENGLYLIGDRKMEGIRANKVLQLYYRSVDNIMEVVPAEIKKGVETKEFKELNSVLLSGSYPQILEIENFIRQLDKVVPMVTIEVILMDVRKGKSIKTGIQAGISDTVKTGGTILSGLDFTFGSKSINEFLGRLGRNNVINLGPVTPNFYARLSALEENSNVEVRSMPKLTTLNGHEANLSIGSTRYYSVTTQNVLGSLNPQTVITQQYNPIQANLSINISPMISGDDQVTLKIDVNISDFIGDPPNNAPPPSSTSQFKSIIRARNDEMIILGGIERTEKSEGGSGIPFLSRIPVIKWFFSSRTKSTGKVVSVVFIRPTIIY